jgi:hypothetical protein
LKQKFHTMLQLKQLMTLAFAALSIAGAFVWKKREAAEKKSLDDVVGKPTYATESKRGNERGATGNSPFEEIAEVKSLLLPPGSSPTIEKEVDATEAQQRNQRVIAEDDAILATGGVIEAPHKRATVDQLARDTRLKSILAKDWQGQGNLLVNELRANRGFEVEFTTVEFFLRGKDLYGWPEVQRNWIGDEMMTMLRQEMPAKAYELFRDIQADAAAPDAMRDYSIQHISHLIADGAVGQEGVALIRAALESNNPVLASTALMSLHRLSEKSPALMKAEEVKEYAQRYENSQDERLKISAAAILKEARE